MFAANARGNIGIEPFVTHGRRVTIARAACKSSQFRQHRRIALDHTREIHDFGQTMHCAIG